MFVKTRKYYINKLSYNTYISNKIKLNELNQYFIAFLENIRIKTTSHVLIKKLVPKITYCWIANYLEITKIKSIFRAYNMQKAALKPY